MGPEILSLGLLDLDWQLAQRKGSSRDGSERKPGVALKPRDDAALDLVLKKEMEVHVLKASTVIAVLLPRPPQRILILGIWDVILVAIEDHTARLQVRMDQGHGQPVLHP